MNNKRTPKFKNKLPVELGIFGAGLYVRFE